MKLWNNSRVSEVLEFIYYFPILQEKTKNKQTNKKPSAKQEKQNKTKQNCKLIAIEDFSFFFCTPAQHNPLIEIVLDL